MINVVAFNGSPNKGGNTNRMLEWVCQDLEKEGIDTQIIHIAKTPLRGCMDCRQCKETKRPQCSIIDDGVNDWTELMIQADGILLGSPTYFSDVTPEMKALIDRGGRLVRASGGLLRHKVGAGVIAVRRAGSIHAFDTINHFFLISEMIVQGSNYWNCCIGGPPGEVEEDEEGRETLHLLAKNMAHTLKRLKQDPIDKTALS